VSLAWAQRCSTAPQRPSARSLTARCSWIGSWVADTAFGRQKHRSPSFRLSVKLLPVGPAAVKLHIGEPEAGQLQGAHGLACATNYPAASASFLLAAACSQSLLLGAAARQQYLDIICCRAPICRPAISSRQLPTRWGMHHNAPVPVYSCMSCVTAQTCNVLKHSLRHPPIPVCRPILRAPISAMCSWTGAAHMHPVPC
jgi:hypothetical protein